MERLRKLAMVLAAGIFLVIFLGVTVMAAGSQNQPKFFVRETNIDMGESFEGADVVYDFVVRNNGAAELQILSVKPG
jgi:hypothetical protein